MYQKPYRERKRKQKKMGGGGGGKKLNALEKVTNSNKQKSYASNS